MVDSKSIIYLCYEMVNPFFIRKRTHILRVVGQYVAKAMLDSRIIDLSFNKVFVKLVLGEEVPLTIDSLRVR